LISFKTISIIASPNDPNLFGLDNHFGDGCFLQLFFSETLTVVFVFSGPR